MIPCSLLNQQAIFKKAIKINAGEDIMKQPSSHIGTALLNSNCDEKTATLSCCLSILQYDNPAHTQSGHLIKTRIRIPTTNSHFAFPGAPFPEAT